MSNSKKVKSAFGLGVEVVSGSVVELERHEKKNREPEAPPEYGLKQVHTEASAIAWIDAQREFAHNHPTSHETAGDPDELHAAMMTAFRCGMSSGIVLPLPWVRPPLVGEELDVLVENLNRRGR